MLNVDQSYDALYGRLDRAILATRILLTRFPEGSREFNRLSTSEEQLENVVVICHILRRVATGEDSDLLIEDYTEALRRYDDLKRARNRYKQYSKDRGLEARIHLNGQGLDDARSWRRKLQAESDAVARFIERVSGVPAVSVVPLVNEAIVPAQEPTPQKGFLARLTRLRGRRAS